MKYIILLVIRLYWCLKPKHSNPKCIFKKSCSHYVFEITKEQGFLKGLSALYFRYKNCRYGYEIFKNPVTNEMQMLLPNKVILNNKEIAERLLKTKLNIMKTTLLILLLTFSINIQSQTTTQKGLLASCCETEGGKCTGSAYCSTCKNCSRCKHCSNGGSCGICAGTSVNTFTSSSKKSTSSSSSSSAKSVKTATNYYAGKTLIVVNATLNLRKEPSIQSEVLEILSKNDKLSFIEEKGDWVKVLVNDSERIGWVYAKYLK